VSAQLKERLTENTMSHDQEDLASITSFSNRFSQLNEGSAAITNIINDNSLFDSSPVSVR
jgi:hypothetical protein